MGDLTNCGSNSSGQNVGGKAKLLLWEVAILRSGQFAKPEIIYPGQVGL